MRFLKWLLGIVVLAVLIAGVGGYFFLKNFDLNKYKSYAAKIVYEHTGRKLDVKGDASLGISMTSRCRILPGPKIRKWRRSVRWN